MHTRTTTAPARTENCVFPTPWTYHFELDSTDEKDSFVAITDARGFEFTTYEGDSEGAHQFIESAHVMEESHQLLQAAKLVVSRWETGDLAEAVQTLGGVIADAERA